ncbi:hypothetical protein [Halomarina oriensis]|uniref:Uncharacterized protein n=1 Tax=Halomarina oriensis TaxID=671145 RepID=A0A6B0GI45_9EURY|nr:hypothetical protein [Halomarina oriensis]MWG33557.1 hypothetical protein [Halomarina oriensis]
MVSGLVDAVLTLGLLAACSLALVGVTYRSLDAVGVPNHYVRSLVATLVAVAGAFLLLDFLF